MSKMWQKKLNICKNMFLYLRKTCASSAGDNNLWNSFKFYNLEKRNFCKKIKILDVFSQQYNFEKLQKVINSGINYTSAYNQIRESCVDLHSVLTNTRVMDCGGKCLNNLFAEPKRTIHNFYLALARELPSDYYKLSPAFKNTIWEIDSKLWLCESTVKWPELKTFSHMDINKKRATKYTASAVVQFLLEKNVISSSGTPILCQKNIFNQSTPCEVCCYSTRSSKQSGNEVLNPPIIDKDFFKEDHQEQDSNRSNIAQLFKTPKNTLGNIFQTVSMEKGSRDFNLISAFQKRENLWVCNYKIKWPEEKSFTASGKTKQIASTQCSLLVLEYLLENNKITKNGLPLIYEKEDIKAIVQSNVPVLYFDEAQIEKLNEIVNVHSGQIFPLICDSDETILSSEKTEDNSDSIATYQRYLGDNLYKAKEKIHLPVSDYKEKIIEMMMENRVLIVKGEPGCGKSTRIPQYILEGWARQGGPNGEPCRIVVTEPRRIAAVSLAERVASERDEEVGNIVGYKVRFKSSFRQKTGRILYCTNGILLRQLKSDPNLSMYTHVVIDEAHERDINTDLLINMLKNMLGENPSLKVVIMSATIDTSLFQNYFEGSAVIHIPGFTFPVKSHFIDNCKLNLEKTRQMCEESQPAVIHDDVVRVLLHLHRNKPEGAILCFLPGWEDIRKIRDLMPNENDLAVLCLHSKLQDSEQWRIFSKSPPGVRKIILSTNISETSVTIDDVVYVVDTGIHKETTFDIDKGIMCIGNHWISQSSVEQRKGRAGRVMAGESYHLYPKSKLESLPKYSLPEILRVSLTKVVLDSKAYSKDSDALEFFSKLPSPPGRENVQMALDELRDLDLIDDDEKLTPLGEVLVDFQLEPKLSKTLVNSVVYKCVTPIVDIVTLFSSGTEMFASVIDRKEIIRNVKSAYSKTSDHLALMRLFEIWEEFMDNGDRRKAEKFCDDMGLLQSRMHMLKVLRRLHFDYLYQGLKNRVLPISDDFSDEDEVVKAVLLSGVGSFLTYKNWDIVKGRLKKSNVLTTRLNHKATVTPDSVNYKNIALKSKYLLYINETRSNERRTSLIRETSVISPLMVMLFSNKKLLLHNIKQDQFSPNLKSEDQVILNLKGTKLNFLLDREQAVSILQCKLALNSCYEYFIYQLTAGGEHNEELNRLWDQLLRTLSDLLNDFKNQ